jgi:hypothetical protein
MDLILGFPGIVQDEHRGYRRYTIDTACHPWGTTANVFFMIVGVRSERVKRMNIKFQVEIRDSKSEVSD